VTPQIVIADHHADDVAAIRRAFEEHRVSNNVAHCRDADDTMDCLTARGRHADRPGGAAHLVLLDVELGGDGLGLLARIRGDARTSRVPVVLLTRARDEARVARGYELGANSVVVKPVDFARFAAAIRVIGMYWTLFNEPPAD